MKGLMKNSVQGHKQGGYDNGMLFCGFGSEDKARRMNIVLFTRNVSKLTMQKQGPGRLHQEIYGLKIYFFICNNATNEL